MRIIHSSWHRRNLLGGAPFDPFTIVLAEPRESVTAVTPGDVAGEPIFSNNNTSPPPSWGHSIDEGLMALVAEDLARYTGESGMAAEFHPLPEGEDDTWSCD